MPELDSQVAETETNTDVGSTEETTSNEGIQETKTQEPSSELKGTKDWYGLDSYNTEGFNDETKAQLKQTLADVQKYTQDKIGSQKKYSFNSFEEAQELFNNTPELKEQLYQDEQNTEEANQAIENPADAIPAVIANWDKIPDGKKQEFYQALSNEQKQLFENSLTISRQNKQMAINNYNQLEQKNEKKYGEGYKESAKDLVSYFEKEYKKNPREFVFRAMNYETYGKQQAELARKSSSNNAANIADTKNNMKTESTGDSMEDASKAFDSVLEKYGFPAGTDVTKI